MSRKKREHLITSLTQNLTVLRTQAELSQEQLASAVDISRQTYSAIETHKRPMSWTVYMVLILFFNSNQKQKCCYILSLKFQMKLRINERENNLMEDIYFYENSYRN